MRKLVFIVSPWAGRGKGSKIKEAVEAAAADHGLFYDMCLTETPGHATTLARRAVDTHDIVVAVGGDGTVHEIVNGLVSAADGQPTHPLGIVPIGSGDDFAYNIGVTRHHVPTAIQRIARGDVRAVDIGRVNDRYYDNELGIAFEAAATVESQVIKAPLGPAVYLLGVLRALMRYSLPHLTIRWEGGEADRPLLLASVANGRRTGGAFLMAPHARVDDGLLDLTFGEALNRLQILRLLPKVLNGTHLGEKPVTTVKTPWVTIDSSQPFPVQADGEVLHTECKHLDIEVLPGRLRVIV